MRLIDADSLNIIKEKLRIFDSFISSITRQYTDEHQAIYEHWIDCRYDIENIIDEQPTAYDIEKVVAEVKKLDLDGVSMVEDGKYKLVRKNEVISLIQTNGVCNGRHNTCADCYKMGCTLSTEKTIADKWSEQVRKGGAIC